MNKTYIGVGVAIIALGVGYFYYSGPKNEAENPGDIVACTADAMMCPDGTYVGRTGSNCQFVCPNTQTQSTKAKFGQRILNNGVYITPIKIIEDSRCPMDVQCIWAGQVIVSAKLERNGKTLNTNVAYAPTTFEGKTISLQAVSPGKKSSTSINQGDYTLTFLVQ